MFGNIGNSILKGMVTLTLLFLSSYEGNNAEFKNLEVSTSGNRVTLNTSLINAFENDFEEVFKTGEPIKVNFTIDVKSAGTSIVTEDFSHKVIYNALESSYLLSFEESDEAIICQSFQELKKELADVEWSFSKLGSVNRYYISVSARLDKIYFPSMNKEFNLMLLWKNKIPKLGETIDVKVAS